jgi:hypothetical protein
MGKKRKREGQDPVQEVYQSVSSIVPRPSTGRPGTPHCFFAESHNVQVSKEHDSVPLVIHSHPNGLAIVTMGEEAPSNIKSVEYLIQPAPDGSAAERRKRQGTLLKKGTKSTKLPGAVLPTTVVVNLHLDDGTIQPVHAGMWGTVLEINENLTPELLARDSLLDGYIAIVQPAAGSFPPKSLELPLKHKDKVSKQSKAPDGAEDVKATGDGDTVTPVES